MGERGLIWYDQAGTESVMPALAVPPAEVIDTNGAGDIFHGAYVYSAMANPDLPWRQHFLFARAASAHAIQHLGNEASLPTIQNIAEAQQRFGERKLAA
jgi:sugar/nucleoside kinase (ribokinase family)